MHYLKIAFQNGIYIAGRDLFLYYIEKFGKTHDESILEKVYFYKKQLEMHKEFDKEKKKEIEKKINCLKKRLSIEL